MRRGPNPTAVQARRSNAARCARPKAPASEAQPPHVYPAVAVPRDWTDLFLTDGPVPEAAQAEAASPEHRRGFFRRLRENMRKTREALAAEVQATLFEGVENPPLARLHGPCR